MNNSSPVTNNSWLLLSKSTLHTLLKSLLTSTLKKKKHMDCQLYSIQSLKLTVRPWKTPKVTTKTYPPGPIEQFCPDRPDICATFRAWGGGGEWLVAFCGDFSWGKPSNPDKQHVFCLPCLKLTACPWELMVGRCISILSFTLFPGAFAASFREGSCFFEGWGWSELNRGSMMVGLRVFVDQSQSQPVHCRDSCCKQLS